MAKIRRSVEERKPAGLYGEKKAPPQIVDFLVASAAMRSKSEGWLPAIAVEITDDAGHVYKGIMRVDTGAAAQIATDLIEASAAALRDIAAAVMAQEPGTGKSHGPRPTH